MGLNLKRDREQSHYEIEHSDDGLTMVSPIVGMFSSVYFKLLHNTNLVVWLISLLFNIYKKVSSRHHAPSFPM